MGIGDGPTDGGDHRDADERDEGAGGLQLRARCCRRTWPARRSSCGRRWPRTPTSMRSSIDLYEILGVAAESRDDRVSASSSQMMWELLQLRRAYAEIVRAGRAHRRRSGRSTPTLMRVDRTPSRREALDLSPAVAATSGSSIRQCRRSSSCRIRYADSPLSRGDRHARWRCSNTSAKFFANDARPGGILQAAGAISDTTAERLKRRLEGDLRRQWDESPRRCRARWRGRSSSRSRWRTIARS